MKKNLFWMLLLALLSACGDNGTTLNEPEPPTPEKPTTVYLNIHPALQSLKQTKAIIEQFSVNDKLGLFVTSGTLDGMYNNITDNANIPANYDGKKWTFTNVEMTDNEATVFAYYPYSTSVSNGKEIPVETSSQTDYLYSNIATANKTNPSTTIIMNHALSLISFKVKKNDYQYAGNVTKIEITGVKNRGTMNISTGKVITTGDIGTLGQDCNYTIDDSNVIKSSIISLPTNISTTSGVTLKVTVDGEVCTYEVPTVHNWEPGYEYIYTLHLRKMHEPTPDLELDIKYWETFGKGDNIVMGSNKECMLRVLNNFQNYGKQTYTNEARYFCCFTYNYGEKWEGKLRMSLWDGNRLVEKYPAYNVFVDKSGIGGWNLPCYVTAVPGTYQLKPLFQPKGSTEWFTPRYAGDVEETDWTYIIQSETTLPALRKIGIKGKIQDESIINFEPLNSDFILEYTISNRAGVSLKGEIKAIWHREFSGEFYETWANDGKTWTDEIGRIRVDITGNEKYHKGEITCKIEIGRPSVTSYSPIVHLYYKADGSDTWEYLRCDCDNTLQSIKGIEDQEIYNSTGNIIGGVTLTMSKNNSFNYVYVKNKQ